MRNIYRLSSSLGVRNSAWPLCLRAHLWGKGKRHNGERKPRPLHLALARPLHRSGKEASRSDLYPVVQAMEAMEVTEAMGALACQTQRDTRADLTEVHIRQ